MIHGKMSTLLLTISIIGVNVKKVKKINNALDDDASYNVHVE